MDVCQCVDVGVTVCLCMVCVFVFDLCVMVCAGYVSGGVCGWGNVSICVTVLLVKLIQNILLNLPLRLNSCKSCKTNWVMKRILFKKISFIGWT